MQYCLAVSVYGHFLSVCMFASLSMYTVHVFFSVYHSLYISVCACVCLGGESGSALHVAVLHLCSSGSWALWKTGLVCVCACTCLHVRACVCAQARECVHAYKSVLTRGCVCVCLSWHWWDFRGLRNMNKFCCVTYNNYVNFESVF